MEAYAFDMAPSVRLTSTHRAALEVCPIELLREYAIDLS
jgi:uncharacterized protein (DUF2237 family)